jgi:hypothetical protein
MTDEECEHRHGIFLDLDLRIALFPVSNEQPISSTLRNDDITDEYHIQLKIPFNICSLFFEIIKTIMWCVYIEKSNARIWLLSTVDFSDLEGGSERSTFTSRTVNGRQFWTS